MCTQFVSCNATNGKDPEDGDFRALSMISSTCVPEVTKSLFF